jgi:hypothetical protein
MEIIDSGFMILAPMNNPSINSRIVSKMKNRIHGISKKLRSLFPKSFSINGKLKPNIEATMKIHAPLSNAAPKINDFGDPARPFACCSDKNFEDDLELPKSPNNLKKAVTEIAIENKPKSFGSNILARKIKRKVCMNDSDIICKPLQNVSEAILFLIIAIIIH